MNEVLDKLVSYKMRFSDIPVLDKRGFLDKPVLDKRGFQIYQCWIRGF